MNRETMGPDDALAINRAGWERVAPKFFGVTALPEYGPLAPTEETLGLLHLRPGMRVLEVGCGSGHSLRWLAARGVEELWGLDFSATQLAFAAETLSDVRPPVRLVESPMERDAGIPAGHFDLVLSIYALGWTTDLPATLSRIAGYLAPGGRLVFSGEHPAYSGLEPEGGRYVVARPYTDEGQQPHQSWKGVPIVIFKRTLATFINETVRAGLAIEQLIETPLDTTNATPEQLDPTRWYTASRARLVPTTFILTARKPG